MMLILISNYMISLSHFLLFIYL